MTARKRPAAWPEASTCRSITSIRPQRSCRRDEYHSVASPNARTIRRIRRTADRGRPRISQMADEDAGTSWSARPIPAANRTCGRRWEAHSVSVAAARLVIGAAFGQMSRLQGGRSREIGPSRRSRSQQVVDLAWAAAAFKLQCRDDFVTVFSLKTSICGVGVRISPDLAPSLPPLKRLVRIHRGRSDARHRVPPFRVDQC